MPTILRTEANLVPLWALATALIVVPSMLPSLAPQLSAQRPPVHDPNIPVEMFESANLDRFLRAAQDHMGKERYGQAIQLLQDVIEGRTGEFVDPEAAKKAKAEKERKAKEAEANKRNGRRVTQPKQPVFELPIDEDNPAYSVFSDNDKIYRPVARLCHELLASMPAEGIGLYRVKFEAIAEKMFQDAIAAGDLPGLEKVYNNYFATLASARAMREAADFLMDSGRFRAAIQTLDTLLEVYPPVGRKEAGVRDLLAMVKMAICYHQLGEFDLAAEQLAATSAAFPGASVRLMGELYTVSDLHVSDLFDAESVVIEDVPVATGAAIDMQTTVGLIPLWEFRYTQPQPYHAKTTVQTGRNTSFRVLNGGGQILAGNKFPQLNHQKPGTSVQFDEGSLVFLDSYRPVVHELTSGRQKLLMGIDKMARWSGKINGNAPRARTPAYDYFVNRVAMDDERFYAIEGYTLQAAGNSAFRPLLENKIRAYDRTTGAEVWVVDSKANRKRPITYLAAPAVHRRSILMPFADGGAYGLISLDSATGQERFRTYLHHKGSDFVRAPAAPVVIDAGMAYVLTNAGIFAAVDANTGELRWATKYDRVHPTRGPRRKPARQNTRNMFGGRYIQPMPQQFLGFAPTDVYVIEDLVLLAAVDSNVLQCLNGANGEVRWMHNGADPTYEGSPLEDKLSYIVGHNKEFLFVMCRDAQLMCIGIKSGLRYWVAAVPGLDQQEWAGRGCVTDEFVIVPGKADTRRVHVIPANTKKQPKFRTVELPAFSIGKEPLSGPANLFVHDAYLALAYEDGVELYSTPNALSLLARASETPLTRAAFFVHAGKLSEAADILLERLGEDDLPSPERKRLSIRVLSLVEEISESYAAQGKRKEALEILHRTEKLMHGPRFVRRVHLYLLQVYRALSDLEGIEREQEYIESGVIK